MLGRSLVLLFLLLLLGCGPRLEIVYLDTPPPGPVATADHAGGAASTSALAPTKREPVLTGDRCQQVCTRIAWMGREAPDPRWIEDCAAGCRTHASEGQMRCFERVERLDDVKACAVE